MVLINQAEGQLYVLLLSGEMVCSAKAHFSLLAL
jgi:hypothetical protein